MKPKSDDVLMADARVVGLEFIGPYAGVMGKSLYRCSAHGDIMQAANKVQQGIGCQKCGRLRQFASRRSGADKIRAAAGRVGLTFVGPYVNGATRTAYECAAHGQIFMTPEVVARGSGCRKCSMAAAGLRRRNPKPPKIYKRPPVTVDRCVSEANAVGLKFIGPYAGMCTKAQYECTVHGALEMVPSSVRRGAGCRFCAGNVDKSRTSLEAEASALGLKFVGPYLGDREKTTYECSSHGVLKKRPGDVHGGKGCAKCAKYGFKADKPAEFYAYRVVTRDTEFIGFGITNDKKTRQRAHAATFSKIGAEAQKIVSIWFEDGRAAAEVELEIKRGDIVPLVQTDVSGFFREAAAPDCTEDLLAYVHARCRQLQA
ncbi:hypothetical protein V5F34_01080 [Xanthobacter autotrophicus]|uniref:hypothetical protein n=1 Tax=Xanthobacter autotrophicus TaxID=280 RepID=UPI00372B86F1